MQQFVVLIQAIMSVLGILGTDKVRNSKTKRLCILWGTVLLIVLLSVAQLVIIYKQDRSNRASLLSGEIKPPSKASSEYPQLVIGQHVVELRTENGVLLRERNTPILSLSFNAEGEICVSAVIKNRHADIEAEIEDNQFRLNNGNYDRNHGDNYLEVRNASGEVVLRLVHVGGFVHLAFIHYASNGYCYSLGGSFSEDMLARLDTDDTYAPIIRNWPVTTDAEVTIAPMCKSNVDLNFGDCPELNNLIRNATNAQKYNLPAIIFEPITIGLNTVEEMNELHSRNRFFFGDVGEDSENLSSIDHTMAWVRNDDEIRILAELRAPGNAATLDSLRNFVQLNDLPYVIFAISGDVKPIYDVRCFLYLHDRDVFYGFPEATPRVEKRGYLLPFISEPLSRDECDDFIRTAYSGYICKGLMLRMFTERSPHDYLLSVYRDRTDALMLERQDFVIEDDHFIMSLTRAGRCTERVRLGNEGR